MSHLKGCVTVLEIVFVGECEVFVCQDFVPFFPLGHEAHRSAHRSVNSLKNVDFSDIYPLKG